MKFAKQKLVILLMLMALPHAFLLALIETPELSSWVLNVSLKITRLRTGLKVDAKSWDVNPVTFSAKLEGVSLEHGDVELYAPRVQVWLSPVALFLGRLHFNDVEFAGAQLKFNQFVIPKKTEKKKEDPPPAKELVGVFAESYPKLFGVKLQTLFDSLSERHITFDDAELSSLKLQTKDLLIQDLNIELNNLQQGQVRLEWNIRGLEVLKQIQRVSSFSGAISLLKASGKEYQVYIGQVLVSLKDDLETESVKIRGAWPGQIVLDVNEDWGLVNRFLKNSPMLKESALTGKNSGYINLQLAARMQEKSIEWIQVDLETRRFVIENMNFNNVKASGRLLGGEKDWGFKVNSLDIDLPRGQGVQDDWTNKVSLKSLDRKGDDLSAELFFEQASLCGILLAVAEPECQVATAFTGPLKASGSLNPFSMHIEPDFVMEAGPILNDPYIKDGEVIVNLQKGKMSGKLLANDRRVVFEEFRLSWKDVDPIEFRGDIIYLPTKVNLRASLESGRFDKMFSNLVGFKFSGHAKIDADIFYDHSLERPKRTVVNAFVRSKNFSFEGQDLGTLSGPIKYLDRKLLLGPFQLRNGGGSGVIHGSLVPTENRGPFMSLVSIFNRFEYVAFLDEKKESEAFRGFVSGRAVLEGHVNSEINPENKLKGDIKIQAKNLKAFDIPFDGAKLDATFLNNDLIINKLEADKDDSTLNLKGFLSDKGGSELIFDSDPIDLKGIEIEPKLSLFEKGTVSISGFWRPKEGWGVDGKIAKASMAGAVLGNGSASLRGDEKGITVDLNWDKLKMNYRGRYEEENILIDSLEVKLKDEGVYAGFAYLGDWRSPKIVEAKGGLSFLWTPDSGYFKSEDLQVKGPHSDEGRAEELINVPGMQELVWNGGRVVRNSLNWNQVTKLKLGASPGDSVAGIDANMPLGLFRLFVPELDARYGSIEVKGTIPLSPHFATLRLDGSIKVGFIKFTEISGELSGLKVDFELQRSQVVIKSARARSGAGNVNIRGVYKIDFVEPAADILISLNQAELVLLEDVPGTFNGELQIRGDKMPYLMSGKINVTNVLYTKEFDSETQEVAVEEEEATLRFNLDVDLGAGSSIRNSVVSSEFNGEMTLTGDSSEPQARGDLVLSNGIIHANQVDFKIIQSRIQFYGDKENIPIVRLRAGTSISYGNTDYRIEMNARGPGDSLAIDFSSDPPLPKKDIVSLLAFGVIRQDEDLGEENDDLLTAAQAEAFQTIFGQAIGNSISKNTGFDVRLKASSSKAGKADNIPKVSVMKKLSERVTARFARSLDVNNPEKDLQVDYQLLNNVNLSGVWESPTPEDSSVGVDLRFRFEIE